MAYTFAFVTSMDHPQITRDDQVLADELTRLDNVCVAAPWEDEETDWNRFDIVLIRSCWNYHLKLHAFQTWISSMQNIKGQLVNSHQLVLWNINKRYLFDLSSKGVAIPDTTYLDIDRYYPAKLLDVMDANGWDRAVLKPCISASAYRTVVITRENAIDEGARLQGNFPEEGMLIQQFAEEIPADGEMSLMFFGRNFSHAVLKTALSGDFRVQKEFGGSVRMIYPGQEIIDQVSQIFDAIPGKPDYARIDGYWKNDRFILMELELIEPVLFFAEVKSAAAEFGARLTRISSGRRATVD